VGLVGEKVDWLLACMWPFFNILKFALKKRVMTTLVLETVALTLEEEASVIYGALREQANFWGGALGLSGTIVASVPYTGPRGLGHPDYAISLWLAVVFGESIDVDIGIAFQELVYTNFYADLGSVLYNDGSISDRTQADQAILTRMIKLLASYRGSSLEYLQGVLPSPERVLELSLPLSFTPKLWKTKEVEESLRFEAWSEVSEFAQECLDLVEGSSWAKNNQKIVQPFQSLLDQLLEFRERGAIQPLSPEDGVDTESIMSDDIEALADAAEAQFRGRDLLDNTLSEDIFFDGVEWVPDVKHNEDNEDSGFGLGLSAAELAVCTGELSSVAYIQPVMSATENLDELKMYLLESKHDPVVDALEIIHQNTPPRAPPSRSLQVRRDLLRLARIRNSHVEHMARNIHTWTPAQFRNWLDDYRSRYSFAGITTVVENFRMTDLFSYAVLQSLFREAGYQIQIYNGLVQISRQVLEADQPTVLRYEGDYDLVARRLFERAKWERLLLGYKRLLAENIEELPPFVVPSRPASYTFCEIDYAAVYNPQDDCQNREIWNQALLYFLNIEYAQTPEPYRPLLTQLFNASYTLGRHVIAVSKYIALQPRYSERKHTYTIKYMKVSVYVPPTFPAVFGYNEYKDVPYIVDETGHVMTDEDWIKRAKPAPGGQRFPNDTIPTTDIRTVGEVLRQVREYWVLPQSPILTVHLSLLSGMRNANPRKIVLKRVESFITNNFWLPSGLTDRPPRLTVFGDRWDYLFAIELVKGKITVNQLFSSEFFKEFLSIPDPKATPEQPSNEPPLKRARYLVPLLLIGTAFLIE